MGHEEARDVGEAGLDVLAQGLQLGVLLLRDLEAALEDGRAARVGAVGRLVGEAPVAHQEEQLLEGRVAGILQRQPAVLGEELQVLQVVLLDVLRQVVHLDAARHRAQREDGGAVAHRALAVEGALRVQQQHRNLQQLIFITSTILPPGSATRIRSHSSRIVLQTVAVDVVCWTLD